MPVNPESFGMENVDGVEYYDKYVYANEILTFVCTHPKDVLKVDPRRKNLFIAQSRCFEDGAWWDTKPFLATSSCFAVGNPKNILPGDRLMIDIDEENPDNPGKYYSDIRTVGRVDGRIITLTQPLSYKGKTVKPLPGGDVIKVLASKAGVMRTYLNGWWVDEVEKEESRRRWI